MWRKAVSGHWHIRGLAGAEEQKLPGNWAGLVWKLVLVSSRTSGSALDLALD